MKLNTILKTTLCACCMLLTCLYLQAQSGTTGSKKGKTTKGVPEAWKEAIAFPKREKVLNATTEFMEATGCRVVVESRLQSTAKKSIGQKFVEDLFEFMQNPSPNDLSNTIRVEVLWSEQAAPQAYVPNMQAHTHMAKQGLFRQEALTAFADKLSSYKVFAPSIKDSQADSCLAAELEQLQKGLNTQGLMVQLYNGDKLCAKEGIMPITDAPTMPKITVKPCKENFPADAKIEVRLEIMYQRGGTKDINLRDDFSAYPTKGWKSLSVNEVWMVDFGDDICGGTAYLLSKYNDKIDTIKFYIRGKNPAKNDAKNYMTLKGYKSLYWFIDGIAWAETKWNQFDGSPPKKGHKIVNLQGDSNAEGEPTYGPPKGFGLMQLDNWGNPKQYATSQHLWSWKENVDGSVAVIEEKKVEVEKAKNRHKTTINKWNDQYPNNKVSDSLKIIAGEGKDTWVLVMEEGNEAFAVTPTSGQHNIYDALWIKYYNGGNPYYQVNQDGESSRPRREINRIYGEKKYYVKEVCSSN